MTKQRMPDTVADGRVAALEGALTRICGLAGARTGSKRWAKIAYELFACPLDHATTNSPVPVRATDDCCCECEVVAFTRNSGPTVAPAAPKRRPRTSIVPAVGACDQGTTKLPADSDATDASNSKTVVAVST